MFAINLKKLKQRVIEKNRHPTVNEGVHLIAYIERLTRIIKLFEWGDEPDTNVCMYCGCSREDGHAELCEVGSVIDNAKGLFEEDANA